MGSDTLALFPFFKEDATSTDPNAFYAVSGDHVFTNYHDYALHRLDLDLERRHKRRPDLSKERIFELMNGLDSDSIEYTL